MNEFPLETGSAANLLVGQPNDPALRSFAADLARLQPCVAVASRDDLLFRAGWEAALAAVARGENAPALEVLPYETTGVVTLHPATATAASGTVVSVSQQERIPETAAQNRRRHNIPAWQNGYFWPAATAVLLMVCMGLVAALNSYFPSGPQVVQQPHSQPPALPPGPPPVPPNHPNANPGISPRYFPDVAATPPAFSYAGIMNNAAVWETLDNFTSLIRTITPPAEVESDRSLAANTLAQSNGSGGYLQLRDRVLRAGLTTWPTEPRTFTATGAILNPLSRDKLWRAFE